MDLKEAVEQTRSFERAVRGVLTITEKLDEIGDLQNAAKAAKAERTKAENELEKLRAEAKKLADENSAAADEVKSTKTAAKKLQADAQSAYNNKLAEAEREAAAIRQAAQDEANTIKSDISKAVAQKSKEVTALEKEIAELEAKRSDTNAALHQLRTQLVGA